MSDLDIKIHDLDRRLKAVEERLSPPEAASLSEMSDKWDRYGERWQAIGWQADEVLWRSSGGVLRTDSELSERGPFTSKSPLAEDQEPLPDVGKDADVEPRWVLQPHEYVQHDSLGSPWCQHCNYGREHRIHSPKEESDGDVLARLGTDAVKWAEEFLKVFGRESALSLGESPKDDGMVTSWFANAIEAGRLAGTSEAYAKNPARPDDPVAEGGPIVLGDDQ